MTAPGTAPGAFPGAPGAGEFGGMADHEVLALAAARLREAAGRPAGTLARARETAAFRRAYAEFARREDARVLRRLGGAAAGRGER